MKLYCHAEYPRSSWPSIARFSLQLLPLGFSASASFCCGLWAILLWFYRNFFFFSQRLFFLLRDGITKSTCSDCGLNVSYLIETCFSAKPLLSPNLAPPARYYWIRPCLPTRWPLYYFFCLGHASSAYVLVCMFIPSRSTACLHVGLIVLSWAVFLEL